MSTTNIKLCEEDKRDQLFSKDSVETALSQDCSKSRGSYSCPNDMQCKDKFTRSTGPGVVDSLRKAIWLNDPERDEALCRGTRRHNFTRLLSSMNKTKQNTIVY